jgi:hypothetical protein
MAMHLAKPIDEQTMNYFLTPYSSSYMAMHTAKPIDEQTMNYFLITLLLLYGYTYSKANR